MLDVRVANPAVFAMSALAALSSIQPPPPAFTRLDRRKQRHRPPAFTFPERKPLKYVAFKGGPWDGRVDRIPRDGTALAAPNGTVVYRDSGEEVDGYPRFDFVEGSA